jgi:hypothetical protein
MKLVLWILSLINARIEADLARVERVRHSGTQSRPTTVVPLHGERKPGRPVRFYFWISDIWSRL